MVRKWVWETQAGSWIGMIVEQESEEELEPQREKLTIPIRRFELMFPSTPALAVVARLALDVLIPWGLPLRRFQWLFNRRRRSQHGEAIHAQEEKQSTCHICQEGGTP